MALSAGSAEEARCAAQWRALQGLGLAIRPGPGPRQARPARRWRPSVRQGPGAVPGHGLAAVEAACAEALEAGLAAGDVILAILARQRQPAPLPSITTPDALRLNIEPAADCGRYDSIRRVA